MIRVLIVDDHAVVRSGLAMLLSGEADIEVVGQAADGAAAVAEAQQRRPDVVLMDLAMPGVGGLEATGQLLQVSPDSAVVVLTTFADRRRIFDALDAGAVGYLMKDSAPTQIVDGIRSAASGGSPLDPRVARTLLDARRSEELPDRGVRLTDKQQEVLGYVAEGLSNRLIARRMQISEKTVKAHLTQVYSQLGVTDRVQAALWAKQHLNG